MILFKALTYYIGLNLGLTKTLVGEYVIEDSTLDAKSQISKDVLTSQQTTGMR